MSNHEKYMRICFALAKKGIGKVDQNPLVGAVTVKNNKIISRGHHAKFGGPHAEIVALKKAGKRARGATLYVNLEPCSHHGKTPPCTDAIINSGIKELVYSVDDPNDYVEGKEILLSQGISVIRNILKEEGKRLNEVFFKYSKTKIPFVALKLAMSLDGKIATKKGDSKWISGKKARTFTHILRNRYQAVMVGVNTVLKDNPLLTCRISGGRNPLKIIVDSTLHTPTTARCLDENTIILTTTQAKRTIAATIVVCKKRNGKVDLLDGLKKLGKLGISSILVEGGGELAGSFIDRNLVDKYYFILAPIIIGGRNAKTVGGLGKERLKDALKLNVENIERLGNDLIIEAYAKDNTVKTI